MPSQTFLVRSHARTIHTHPVTFVCAQCHTTTTREIYPGKMPQYCLSCRPQRKKSAHTRPAKGMFHPTHYLIAANGRKTEVCLEKSSNPGWSWVRTALDWFSGSSIIQYHPEKGIISKDTPLEGYSLVPLPADKNLQPLVSKTKSKSRKKANTPTAPVENRPYSGRTLMKRLKCGDRLLRIKRSQPDFAEWSRERDPEGVAWQYQGGQFVPLETSQPDSTSVPVILEVVTASSSTKSKTKQQQKTASAQAVPLENRAYSGRQLMKRFKCGERLLRIQRSQPDFTEWSRQRDPEGVAWQYQGGQFVPLVDSKLDSTSSQVEPEAVSTSSSTKSKTKQKQKTIKKNQKKTSVQAVPLENRAYSGRQLMKRFGCGERLLRIKRDQPDFAEWSRQRDPEDVAWQYQKGQFVPLVDSKLDSNSGPVEPEAVSTSSSTKSKTKQQQKTIKKNQKKTSAKATLVENKPHSGRQLMKRLKCGDRLLRIKRDQPDFAEWSRQRDPEGIAWQYQRGQFVPQIG